jgi:hypothetical protein
VDPDVVAQLEKVADLAGARLGVAEDLAWPIAILSAIAVNLKWGWSWYIAIPLAIAVYFAVRHPYARAEARAEDNHHRAARLGKYMERYEERDAV